MFHKVVSTRTCRGIRLSAEAEAYEDHFQHKAALPYPRVWTPPEWQGTMMATVEIAVVYPGILMETTVSVP